jgi:hypothetical protein
MIRFHIYTSYDVKSRDSGRTLAIIFLPPLLPLPSPLFRSSYSLTLLGALHPNVRTSHPLGLLDSLAAPPDFGFLSFLIEV